MMRDAQPFNRQARCPTSSPPLSVPRLAALLDDLRELQEEYAQLSRGETTTYSAFAQGHWMLGKLQMAIETKRRAIFWAKRRAEENDAHPTGDA